MAEHWVEITVNTDLQTEDETNKKNKIKETVA